MLEDKETLKMSQAVEAVDDGSAKKPYQSPQIRVYGNIREVTQGFGNNRRRDGGGSGARGFKSLP